MTLAPTYRRRLHERALEQYGYVTTDDANELGVPPVELRKLAQRGGLSREGHGLYRFDTDDIPVTGRDGYMRAILEVGGGAFLWGDAVLALHDLALVNPVRIRVGTPRRVQKRTIPGTVQVVQATVPPEDLEIYEGIRTTTVARALIDCIGLVMPERLLAAANDAVERGLLRRKERELVLAKLGGPHAGGATQPDGAPGAH